MKLNTDWHDEYLASYAKGEASTSICERLGIPASAPWSHEDQNHNDFAFRISKAREARAHTLADQMLMISDDDSGDTFVDAKGVERSSFENVQRSRLAVDTRKYLTGKLFSRFYGERMKVDTEDMTPKPSVEEQVERFVANIPILNNLLGKHGYKIVPIGEAEGERAA